MSRSIPRLLRGLAVISAASLVLTACGDSDDDAGGGDATTGEETTEQPADQVTEVLDGDGVLTIGTLLPDTGSLAFLGPPMFAGAELAVQEINDAGGVLGKDVKLRSNDSGDTTTDIASQSVDRLLKQDADTIVGAASSSVSLTVIDKIVGANVAMFSPANTSDAFTTYDDKGLYFRTAPPDVIQGQVLGEIVIEEGNSTACILALQDAYGEGLANNAETSITEGGGEVLSKQFYDPKTAEFSSEVSEVKSQDCEAVVIIGFDESTRIFGELISQGMSTSEKDWFLVDGNSSNYGDQLEPGTLDGAMGTYPGAEVTSDFENRLKEVDPNLKDLLYGPETYDSVILSALAAVAADNDSGTAVASKLQEVSTEGEKCTEYAECVQLLEDGQDIDYDGVSGPIEFNDAGDPTQVSIAINEWGQDNTYETIDYREGTI